MQEENQERMEGKCFKEGVTNCVKCCHEAAKDGDWELAIGFGLLKIIGDHGKSCSGGVMATKLRL